MVFRAALGLSAAALAVGVTMASAPEAEAQSTVWDGGSPVFASQIKARQKRIEAEREARRKKYPTKPYPAVMDGGGKPDLTPKAPEIVSISTKQKPGTVIVDTEGRRLFYVLNGGRAYMYPISVGRDGFTWTGTQRISRVADWPTWTPPPEMRRRQPYLPRVVKGGVINPLGAKALYLGSSIYRIHGTNNKRSIGRASSSGCFRMMNEHVLHLAQYAKVGTKVVVVKRFEGRVGPVGLMALFQ